MLMPVLAVGVVVHSGENHRPAGAATGCGAKGVGEAHTLGCECVQVRRLDDLVAVTAQGFEPVIVADDQDDVGSLVLAGECFP